MAAPAARPAASRNRRSRALHAGFAPDLAKETFRGRETIRVTLTEPATSITLHAAEITFGEVTITSGGRTQTATVTTDAKNETATFTVPERLGEGQATIQIPTPASSTTSCAASTSARRTAGSTR